MGERLSKLDRFAGDLVDRVFKGPEDRNLVLGVLTKTKFQTHGVSPNGIIDELLLEYKQDGKKPHLQHWRLYRALGMLEKDGRIHSSLEWVPDEDPTKLKRECLYRLV